MALGLLSLKAFDMLMLGLKVVDLTNGYLIIQRPLALLRLDRLRFEKMDRRCFLRLLRYELSLENNSSQCQINE